jgi:hypothetical protein
VQSENSADINVRLSTASKTNRLRKVCFVWYYYYYFVIYIQHQITTPLGATFTMDYARSGNTPTNPHPSWVLSTLLRDDGVRGDGQDISALAFK